MIVQNYKMGVAAVIATAALTVALPAGAAMAGEGEAKRCDSAPKLSNSCRMGDRVYELGEIFRVSGTFWQVKTVNGGTYRVEIPPPDTGPGYSTP